jgi:hypothetical protein
LSTSAQSSATRIGWCSGSTTLPARIATRFVIAASAAPATAGFGEQPAEGVEVPLGRPHRAEAVRVREARALEQQPIALGAVLALVAREVEQAELGPRARRSGADAARDRRRQHDLETARERPQQLEHRDVEGRAGDRQPGARRVVRDVRVDRREEAGHVAVLDEHALGPARGAGRVDGVGQVRGARAVRRRGRAASGRGHARRDAHERGGAARQALGVARVGDEHRGLAVVEHERQPLGREGRVERHVGSARLEDGEDRDDELGRALDAQAHELLAAHAARAQLGRQGRGAGVELGVAKAALAADERGRRRSAARLLLEERVHAGLAARAALAAIPLHELELPLLRRDHGQPAGRPLGIAREVLEQRGEPGREGAGVGGRDAVGRVDEPAGAARRVDLERALGAVGQRGRAGLRCAEHADGQQRPVALLTQRGEPGVAREDVAQPAAALGQPGQLGAQALGEVGERTAAVELDPQRDARGDQRRQGVGIALEGRVGPGQVEDVATREPAEHDAEGRREHGRERLARIARGHGGRQRDVERRGARRALVRPGRDAQRHRDRVQLPQPPHPVRLAEHEALVELVEAPRERRGQRVETLAGGQAEARRDRRHRERTAAQVGELRQRDRSQAGGHAQLALVEREQGARRIRRALALVDGHGERARDDHGASAVEQLGAAQGVLVAAEGQPAHERLELGRRARPVEDGGGARPAAAREVAAALQVLRARPDTAVGQRIDESAEGLERVAEALGVQAQGGLVGLDAEADLGQDRPLVDTGRHLVPGDAVLRPAFDERPGRRVQPGRVRQRAVMEVDRAPLRQAQQRLRHQREVRDREQVLERAAAQLGREVGLGVEHRQLPRARPVGDALGARDHAVHRVAAAQQHVAALREERSGTDQPAAEHLSRHLISPVGGWIEVPNPIVWCTQIVPRRGLPK